MINAGAPDSWEFEFDEQPVLLELVDSQPVVTAIVRSTNRIGGLTIERAGGGSQVGKINWTLQGFAAQGVVLLAGEGGCGKTSLMYRAAESIQEGDLFLNEVEVRKGDVLVIQGDEPRRTAENKFRRMGLKQSFSISYPDPPLDTDALSKVIRSGDYSTIIIDSATSLLTGERQETSDESFVRMLYNINKLCEQQGVLAIITTHLNKPIDGQLRKTVTIHDISGRAGIAAAVTDIWAVWRDPNPRWENHYNMICLGKRNCRKDEVWLLQGGDEDYYWEIKETSDGILPQETLLQSQKIKLLLTDSKKEMNLTEISKQLGTSYEVARRICSDLYDQGLINRTPVKKTGRGRPSYLYGIFPI
jgi:hypothetical protein